MENFKKFEDFLNEMGGGGAGGACTGGAAPSGSFSTVGNTPGMGNVVAPGSGHEGSGDQWPSLGVGMVQSPEDRKKTKKQMKENKKKTSLPPSKFHDYKSFMDKHKSMTGEKS